MPGHKQRDDERMLRPHFCLRPVSATTSQPTLSHLTGGSCSKPTERRTAAGRGEVDSLFITLMLAAGWTASL